MVPIVIISGSIILFMAFFIFHRIMLHTERGKIQHIGTFVEVDGHNMNVYSKGQEAEVHVPIILMSGSGVTSPIYDYKLLYDRLANKYKVVVIEKFGYGYSDTSGLPRDVATMVDEDRKALIKAGIHPPYVLMPHSMSALESIWWVHAYPDEIEKIIGLDMAVPESYSESNMGKITLMRVMTCFGIHRIPMFCPAKRACLTDDEYKQNRLLAYRNTLGRDVYHECAAVQANAKAVGKLHVPSVPMLMFTTNLGGGSGHENWMKAQTDFANRAENCTQIFLDCEHNLHFEKSEYVAQEIIKFLT